MNDDSLGDEPVPKPGLRLDEVSHEELLAELHRRFGDSWCSFSSGVRAKGECPICHADGALTRHHLVPVAVGAGRDREVSQRYVKLCRRCHELAHTVWGPGQHYAGPEEREIFVLRLREEYAKSARESR